MQKLNHRVHYSDFLGDPKCDIYRRAGVLLREDMQLCYGSPGWSFPCDGDSGGPLICHESNNHVCLIGLLTYIPTGCDNSLFPNIFTSTAVFEHWIKRQNKFPPKCPNCGVFASREDKITEKQEIL